MAQPPFSLDAALVSRLAEIGKYDSHRPSWLGRWLGVPGEIEWETPSGLANQLAPISVAFWFPPWRNSAAADLPRLLDALDEFRGNLADHIAKLKNYLVECFRECYESQLEEFERQRLADVSGTVSDAAILRDVQSIHLRFDATGKAVLRTAWIAVGWGDEHGVDVEWDAAGEPTRLWREVGNSRR